MEPDLVVPIENFERRVVASAHKMVMYKRHAVFLQRLTEFICTLEDKIERIIALLVESRLDECRRQEVWGV